MRCLAGKVPSFSYRNPAADAPALQRATLLAILEASLGRPSAEGYFPRGRVVPEMSPKPAAERAVDMLLAKLSGQPYETEVRLPRFQPIGSGRSATPSMSNVSGRRASANASSSANNCGCLAIDS